MTKNANGISLKKSCLKTDGKPNLPSPDKLVFGELAVNYAEGVETISTKNESGDVVTFSSDDYFKSQNLAWEKGTGTGSAKLVSNSGTASGNFAVSEGQETIASGSSTHAEGFQTTAFTTSMPGVHAEGYGTYAYGGGAHAEGNRTTASGESSHAEGSGTTAAKLYSHAEGLKTVAGGISSHAEGEGTIANNIAEHASGKYNISSSASTTWGDSGNTLFSVGNGTAEEARHNAFEIRQNGDIYIVNKDGNDVKLQDEIGNITVDQVLDNTTSASTNPVSSKAVYDAVTGHTADTDIHVTTADKTAWNAAVTDSHTHSNKSALDAITGNVGTMAYENKNSYSSATEVNSALAGKAATATTLAGYGITDAYTKAQTSGATELSTALAGKSDTSHTHASSAVTSMAGYTMAASGTPITTGDTLNQAIGKLEKQNDEIADFIEEKELAIAAAITDLDDRKLDKSTNKVTVTAITTNKSSSCSITGASNDGNSETIIYTNSTNSNLIVTVPTIYKTPNNAALEIICLSGGYCEVNYINVNGVIYARAI